MEKTITRIKDIAEKAQVSTGTVDRVLHNRGRVSEEVRQRVLQIAKEMNYEPNLLARALVTNRTYTIAALIPDPAADSYWQAPKTGIEKAETELKQYGVVVKQFIFDPFHAASFRENADKLTNSIFDAILVAPIFYRESLTYFNVWKKKGVPFVLFNTHIPDYEPLMYIGQDSYLSGYLAGKIFHFGHQESGTFLVAHIDENMQDSSHLVKKEQGFSDYFQQNTSPASYNIIHTQLNRGADKEAFAAQLDKLLTGNAGIKGIFVTNSKSYMVAEYLQERGHKKINLVGYDLVEKNLHFLNAGVINFLINQNPKGQGYHSIYGLADHLIFKKKVEPIKYLPLDIITKENLQYYYG